MNGVVIQTSMKITTPMISELFAVQAMPCSISPRLWSSALMTPNWSLNIQSQIFVATTTGMAQGTRIAARTRPRPGIASLINSAMERPRTVSIATEMTGEDQRILDGYPPSCGRCSTSRKLSRPTME